MNWKPELDDLARREAFAREMGGVDKVKRQRDQGRLTVRERIDGLIDQNSFHEIGAISGVAEYDERGELTNLTPANCVFGRGKIDGPDGGRGRRRFYGARRLGRCVDLGEAADGRGDGARFPAADHPRDRRLRRRRLGEDHRDQGRGQSARRRRRHRAGTGTRSRTWPACRWSASGSARSRASARRGSRPAIIPS